MFAAHHKPVNSFAAKVFMKLEVFLRRRTSGQTGKLDALTYSKRCELVNSTKPDSGYWHHAFGV
jgi:hypothetical protein